MLAADLKRQLRRIGPIEFVETRLFDNHAWCFPSPSGDDYESARKLLGEVLKVPAQDIAVVGSGKYGFSLAPSKDFRPFQGDDTQPNPSDLDLVVVSRSIFNATWHNLRRADYNGAVDARRFFQEDIFRRFVMVGTNEKLDTKYLSDLNILLNTVRKRATTRLGIVQEIKMRIYCSWSDAKSYHIWSLQKLGEKHGIQ